MTQCTEAIDDRLKTDPQSAPIASLEEEIVPTIAPVMDNAESRSALIQALSSNDAIVRCHAMVELGILGDRQALTRFDRLMGNADIRVRRAVADALIQFPQPNGELPGAIADRQARAPPPHRQTETLALSCQGSRARADESHARWLIVGGAIAAAFVIGGIWTWWSG
jgi:hypothetical protein